MGELHPLPTRINPTMYCAACGHELPDPRTNIDMCPNPDCQAAPLVAVSWTPFAGVYIEGAIIGPATDEPRTGIEVPADGSMHELDEPAA